MHKLLRLEVKVLMELMKQVCTLNQVLSWKADKMFTLSIADNTQHSKHRWSSSTTLRHPKNIFQWVQKWKVCFQRTCGQPTRGDKIQWKYKQYEQKTWSSIADIWEERKDEWAQTVKGWLEYAQDLLLMQCTSNHSVWILVYLPNESKAKQLKPNRLGEQERARAFQNVADYV